MIRTYRALTVTLLAASLTACSSSGSFFGFQDDDQMAASAAPTQYQIPPSQAEMQATPAAYDPSAAASAPMMGASRLQLGDSVFEPEPPTPGSATGTYVGLKITQLREDLRKLQSFVLQRNNSLQEIRRSTVGHSQAYHGIVAAISARLQVGTTRNNPILVQQWNQAQLELSRINDDVTRMNNLANSVASDAAFASFLLDSTESSYNLSGAVDEDHRQLAILEDEVQRTVVLVDRLLTELSEDLRRQNNYANSERSNLMGLSLAIKNGELYGSGGLANIAFPPALKASQGRAGSTASSASELAARGEGRPLVVIRFDQPNVDYQDSLYSAISQAINRRPNTVFDVVAVAPQIGSPTEIALNANRAKKQAEDVVRSLSEIGVPPSQVTLGSITSDKVEFNEVKIFVR